MQVFGTLFLCLFCPSGIFHNAFLKKEVPGAKTKEVAGETIGSGEADYLESRWKGGLQK